MANLKIIWTTDRPFSPACINKIAYETSSGEWNVYRDGSWCSQSASTGRGYRPATAKEIEEHWEIFHPKWKPEKGDKVIVTQHHKDWYNKRGVIVEKHDEIDYWRVQREDGESTIFSKSSHMILVPYEESVKPVETTESTSPESKHGFTIGDIVIPNSDKFKGKQCIVKVLGSCSVGVQCPSGVGLGHTLDGRYTDDTGWWYHPSSLELVSKVEPEASSKPSISTTPSIPPPKEGYVTVRIFTEEEFRSKDLWSKAGHPKFWNSDRMMNKYLGTYIQVHKSSFNGDNSFGYDNWHFRVDNYEVIYGIVETKEPEMKKQKFKIGERVTYKSTEDCGDGYCYGGINQDGYVGTIKSYGGYNSTRNCYIIIVSTKEGGEYSMLESEFYEYDGIHPKVITSATSLVTDVCTVAPGTANIISVPLDTWGVHIHKTSSELKEVDNLAKYDQAPVILQKKPKRKLITVKTY